MSHLIRDYLNYNLPTVRTGGLVNGAIEVEVPSDSDAASDSENGSNHGAEEYVEEEMKKYFTKSELLTGLNDIVDMEEESLLGSELPTSDIPPAFNKFNFSLQNRKQLPIDSFKDRIIEMVNTNSVVIIHGPTGCGKTTQVPQYIMDECRLRKQRCNIIVTQPRRIAALNISRRVCVERGWAVGSVCGYQIGLDKNAGDDVILTYVTTEILLQKLINLKNLNTFTHILIDEVHERNKNMDFLLLVVRKFLFTNSPNVKIILMSATMHSEEFAKYFGSISRGEGGGAIPAPILNVNKKSEYYTNIYHLDQLKPILPGSMPIYDINNPCIELVSYQLCLKLIKYMNQFDEMEPVTNNKIIGSVLVFLPGFHEIEEMHKLLEMNNGQNLWDIIPMHSSLTNESLEKAFEKPKKGIRKIILSTNIAESSVTVPDVHYVVDFCLTKQLTTNLQSKFCTLALEWASHSNCTQRAGRVGRVANGKVYRLVPLDFYNNEMPKVTIPEIQRAPLENIVLCMKMLDFNDTPKHVLSLALNPPNLRDVETCVWRLKEAGALLQTCGNKPSAADGDLTFIGRVAGNLPIDVNLTKLIILGHMFCCLEETIIMASGCTTRNLFRKSFNERLQSYRKKLVWADGSCSDLIAMVNLFNVWVKCKVQHRFRNASDEVAWCRTHHVNYKALLEWDILIKEIRKRLEKYGIVVDDGPRNIRMKSDEKTMILKVIICGAFYPNYFIRSSDYGQVDVKEAVKMLSGRNPFNTVYFTNMKPNHPGQIYVRAIKKMIGGRGNIHVGFEMGSSKIFVEFKDKSQPETITVDGRPYITTISNNIVMDVYEAVKKRQLRMKFSLQILSDAKAMEFAKQMETKYKQIANIKEEALGAAVEYNPMPTLDCQYMTFSISHFVDAGHFYVHNLGVNTTANHLKSIFMALNRPGVVLTPVTSKIRLHSELYAAQFNADKKFYRCRVTNIADDVAMAYFVDYGNTQSINLDEIYGLPECDEVRLPPLAVCCALCEIRPSLSPSGLWSPAANDLFKQQTHGVLLYARVYSVVAGVIHLELFKKLPGREATNVSLNDHLVKKGYAEKCQESFLSKMDHGRRVQVQASHDPVNEATRMTVPEPTGYTDFESPQMRELKYTVDLKGPFSPLEMHISGMVQATSGLNIRIDGDSVNAVLLDDNPEDPHARLVVAASVGQTASGASLNLNQTTVMPSIPGFPKLMLLTFAPVVEPKTNDAGTRVTSLLCGLGAREDTNKSNFPVHDIPYPLDTKLGVDFIYKVNELRFLMNRSIKTMEGMSEEMASPHVWLDCQKGLIEVTMKLLSWNHESCPRVEAKYASGWHQPACDIESLRMETGHTKEDIWPLHCFVKLNNDKNTNVEIDDNLEQLQLICKKLIDPYDIHCLLCGSHVLATLSDVRVHLFRDQHKMKLAQYKS